MIRVSLTCANEEVEAVERFTRSHLEEHPTPWRKVLNLERIERDCFLCGFPEPGWFVVTRLLYGCNTGTVVNDVYWDGCCGRKDSSHGGPTPLIRRSI
jgi:hypothetical protein